MGMASPPEEKKNKAAEEKGEVKITVNARRADHHHRTKTKPPPNYKPFKVHSSWLVPCFVVVNIVLFLIVMFINNCPEKSNKCYGTQFLGRFAFQSLKENPLLGPSGSTLQRMGALEVKKIVEDHQVWLLITCTWLHAGLFHIFANMLSLVLVGIRLEQEFGSVRIGLLYIISGIGGSLLSALFIRNTISVGASGALFGLLGGMLSELLTNWTIYANKLVALLTLVVIIAINLAMGILPHVDNYAHVGGFLTGFLLGFVILMRPQYAWVRQKHAPSNYGGTPSQPKYKTYQFVMLGISLAFLISGFAVGLVLLLRGVDGNDHCPWCHYFSCVPTPLWKCKPNQVYCESGITGNQLDLKCLTNGKSKTYMLTEGNTTSILEQICSELCS